ncbi:diguanylate cyclase domain-containing protein, partial [Maricaulis sp. CAU 1757]
MGRSLDSKLGTYVNVVALITLIASVLTIYFFVGALNRNAERTDRVLLSAGIDATVSQNNAWATDYGWWNENRYMVETKNLELMSEVFGSSFNAHGGFDYMGAINATDDFVYGWLRETGSKPRSNLFGADEISAIRANLRRAWDQGEHVASHAMEIDGQIFLTSFTTLGAHEDRSLIAPETEPVLIVGTRVDQGFFNLLEERFLLNELAMHSDEHAASGHSVPLLDAGGHQIAHVSFTASRPGLDLLRLALLPLLGYIVVIFFGAQLIIRKAGRLARQAEKNEQIALRAAGTDSLTGLPNRQAFTDYLSSDAASAAADNGEAAVIYIDLNGFKAVNDKLGHRAGDQVVGGGGGGG